MKKLDLTRFPGLHHLRLDVQLKGNHEYLQLEYDFLDSQLSMLIRIPRDLRAYI